MVQTVAPSALPQSNEENKNSVPIDSSKSYILSSKHLNSDEQNSSKEVGSLVLENGEDSCSLQSMLDSGMETVQSNSGSDSSCDRSSNNIEAKDTLRSSSRSDNGHDSHIVSTLPSPSNNQNLSGEPSCSESSNDGNFEVESGSRNFKYIEEDIVLNPREESSSYIEPGYLSLNGQWTLPIISCACSQMAIVTDGTMTKQGLINRGLPQDNNFVFDTFSSNGTCDECSKNYETQDALFSPTSENAVEIRKVSEDNEDVRWPGGTIETMEDLRLLDGTIEDVRLSNRTIENVRLSDETIEDVRLPDETNENVRLSDRNIENVRLPDGAIEAVRLPDRTIEDISLPDKTIEVVRFPDETIETNEAVRLPDGTIETYEDVRWPDGTFEDVKLPDENIGCGRLSDIEANEVVRWPDETIKTNEDIRWPDRTIETNEDIRWPSGLVKKSKSDVSTPSTSSCKERQFQETGSLSICFNNRAMKNVRNTSEVILVSGKSVFSETVNLKDSKVITVLRTKDTKVADSVALEGWVRKGGESSDGLHIRYSENWDALCSSGQTPVPQSESSKR